MTLIEHQQPITCEQESGDSFMPEPKRQAAIDTSVTWTVTVLAAIAFCAFAFRIAPLLRPGIQWAIYNDSSGYLELAEGLRGGCGFARLVDGTCKSPELERTPGYPLFLASMPSLRWAIACQAIIGGLLSFLIGIFAWRQWGPRAGVLAGLLLGVDIPSILCSSWFLSETLFTALVTPAVMVQLWVMSRGRLDSKAIEGGALAGALIGCAAMVRPIALVLLILIPAPFLLLRDAKVTRRLGSGVLTLVIPVVMVFAWSLRNYQERGKWTFSTMSTFNLFAEQAAGVTAFESGRNWFDVYSSMVRSLNVAPRGMELADDWRNEVPLPVLREIKESSWALVRGHPWVVAWIMVKGLLWESLTPEATGLSHFFGNQRVAKDLHTVGADQSSAAFRRKVRAIFQSPMIAALAGVQMLLMIFIWIGVILALGRAWRGGRREAELILIPLAFVLFMLGAAAGLGGTARYRVPAMPILAMLGGVGWAGRWQAKRLAVSGAETNKTGERTGTYK